MVVTQEELPQIELAMVHDQVSNETIGKMRMQFWRDAINGITEVRIVMYRKIKCSGRLGCPQNKPARHPIALALNEAAQHAHISAYHLKRIVDARVRFS